MGLTADFRESDLFSDVEGVYDVIVSNPPYIATKELEGLMPEVRIMSRYWHLTEWKTGYIFTGRLWRRQVNIWNRRMLCFEIGYDQGEALKEMMTEAGYGQVKIIKDLAGLDRVAIGQKNNNWNAL